jgi:hypothetical protein
MLSIGGRIWVWWYLDGGCGYVRISRCRYYHQLLAFLHVNLCTATEGGISKSKKGVYHHVF